MKSMYANLLLASTSTSRRELLQEAQIPFQIIDQSADEHACSWEMPVDILVQKIARLKMNYALVPDTIDADMVCVVTADTLVSDEQGIVYGKPESRDGAMAMICALRNRPLLVSTGMCVERRIRRDGMWFSDKIYEILNTSRVVFSISDEWITWYVDHTPSMFVAGAVAFDNIGLRFAKNIEGSVASIRGLPVYELHHVLTELAFFEMSAE